MSLKTMKKCKFYLGSVMKIKKIIMKLYMEVTRYQKTHQQGKC